MNRLDVVTLFYKKCEAPECDRQERQTQSINKTTVMLLRGYSSFEETEGLAWMEAWPMHR